MSTQQHRTRRAGAIVGATIALAAMVLTGCTSAPTPDQTEAPEEITGGLDPQPLAEPTTIVINTAARIESFTALFLADYMGEFEKENITVEFTQVASADALVSLGQNQIQMMGVSPSASLFNAIGSGVDMRVVFPGYLNNLGEDGWWMSNDVIENGAESLKGATLASAVGPGSATILGLAAYLETGGLTVKDVTVQAFPAADVATALTQGAVQGAYITSPVTTVVREAGVAEYVDSMPDGVGSAIAAYVIGPQLLEDTDVAAAVVRAMARTVITYLDGDYKSDPEMVENIAAALDRTPEEIEATPALEFDPTFEIRGDYYTQMQELWLEVGGLLSYSEPLEPSAVIDTQFIDAVLGK